jgi:hypothetical protein
MTSPFDRYLAPAYASPKSPYQVPNIGRSAAPQPMARSSSHDPHRALGYFDIPSRSAPSSPQMSYLPYSPVSRSSSPARDIRKSREYAHSHSASGSDLDDALVGFSLTPNWLKMAVEQDQLPSSTPNTYHRQSKPYSPLSSPNSEISTSAQNTPAIPRTPQLNLEIPKPKEVISNAPLKSRGSKPNRQADEDRRYWDEEEDDGYFGEMEEEGEEDLEEAYRSIY